MSEAVIEKFLDRADPDQRKAITHPLGGGPAILVAGAGSGKTFTLTARVAWLVAQGVPPRRILAITFTNKAADELRERIGVADESVREAPRISTIHSLALSAIRKDPSGFGLSQRVTPLDEYDAADMIDTLVQAKIVGAKKDSPWADFDKWRFMEKLHYHRARGLGFAVDYTPEVDAAAKLYQKGAFALNEGEQGLWKEYEDAKQASSVVDFDDMIHLVVRRGKTDAEWSPKLGRQFLHILVDESQDTAPIQWEFLELMVGQEKDDIFAVGDVSQSIMGFQGAAPHILFNMSKSWRGVVPTVYKLQRNYRSVPDVVKLANEIQSNMKETIPLVMESQKEASGSSIFMMRGATASDIAAKIAEKIAFDNRDPEKGLRFRDNAILVRSKAQIKDVEAALITNRVPYVIRGGSGLFQSREAKDLVAYLRIISNPKDLIGFTRACSVPRRGLGDASIRAINTQAAKGHDGDLVAAAIASPNPKMNDFGGLIRQFQVSIARNGQTATAILSALVDFIGYKALVRARYAENPEEAESKLALVDKVLEAIGSIESGIEGASLEDVVFRLTMDKEEEESTQDDRGGKAVISTIHSAKGLEWERVFVTNVIERSLPHWLSMGSEAEIEEERRLFYVACTRPRRILYVCVPSFLQWGPKQQQASPSRFLDEIQKKKASA